MITEKFFKNNRIPCYMLTDEEFDFLKAIHPEKLEFWCSLDAKYIQNQSAPLRMECQIYRLKEE